MSVDLAHVRGRWGEALARCFLEHCGFVCLHQRYRCVAGEIDLVLGRGRLVVFAEVKARGPRQCGRPEEAVDARKLLRLRRVARHYIWRHPPPPASTYRFDVIAVEFRGEGRGVILRHYENVG